MQWAQGDVLTLPAGCTTVHTADSADPAGVLLYRVTDAPLLGYLGATATEARFEPTRFDGGEARARLAEVERDPEALGRSRVSVLLGNRSTPQTLTATHTLWAMLGVLPAGRVQRPHRHQSAALDLITECASGCYSLIGSRLDAEGAIVDPQRVDWEPAGAFVTPPGLWHSHHNESGPSRLPGPRPGCRPAHLPPLTRHPVLPDRPLSRRAVRQRRSPSTRWPPRPPARWPAPCSESIGERPDLWW